MLGDDALIYSHRLSEWCSHAPDLEEDIALANIALDLLGQARLLLARAAAADPSCVPALPAGSPVPAEDALAFFRSDRDFRNVRLVEVDNGDFAVTIVRLLLFSTWRLALLQRLVSSRDHVLAAIAAKGVKEVTYHRDYAGRWFLTLAQGTDESRSRLLAGLDLVWRMHDELFVVAPGRVDRRRLRCRRGPVDSRRRGLRRARAGLLGQRGRPSRPAAGRSGQRRDGSPRSAHRVPLAPARRDAVRRPRPPRRAVVTMHDPASKPSTIAASVTDPEMPMLTLEDLGVLRSVSLDEDGTAVVTITPTYSGCPAMATMRDDLVHRLEDHGVRRRRTREPVARLVERLDHPTRSSGARRARHLGTLAHPPDRRSGGDLVAADPSRADLSSLRERRRRADLGVRADGVQGDLPLRVVPRAVRAREGDLMVSTRSRSASRVAPSTPSPSPTSNGSATTRSR